ncbi:acyltransferase [Cohnella suwonensis]|uniref:Acyltransferase n=1 Tax=Cohnella suwonensis TaxID=696072 RepID=A0ABW0LNU6_9BACL
MASSRAATASATASESSTEKASGAGKIQYLDVYRAISILAVILIHTTAYAIGTLPKDDPWYPAYLIVNAASYFAVPSFLFLSALVHFYNYDGRSGIRWGTFYGKRLLSIVLPYVAWSIFYYLFVSRIKGVSPMDRIPDFFRGLLYGNNYTHLYFIVIMIQFFVLFPLFLAFARLKWVRSNLPWIGIACQVAFYLGNYYYFHMTRTGVFVGSYMLYLFLGAYAGIRLKSGKSLSAPGRKILLSSAFLFGAVYVGQVAMLAYEPGYLEQPYRSWVNFATTYGYCSLCCFALIYVSMWLHGRGGRLALALKSIGIASFGIYFFHPFVLYMWRDKVMQNFPSYFELLLWGSGAAALVASWLFVAMVKKSRVASVVLVGER